MEESKRTKSLMISYLLMIVCIVVMMIKYFYAGIDITNFDLAFLIIGGFGISTLENINNGKNE